MKNLIIDSTNLLHRTYYSSKKTSMINDNEQDVSHIYYFLKAVKDYIELFKPDNVYLCWDRRQKDFINFRQELVEYKENRNRDENENVHLNDDIIYELCTLLGIINIKSKKLEADDIIAWLTLEVYKEEDNIIVSTDKDFYQLIGYNDNVKIFSPFKNLLLEKDNFVDNNDGVKPEDYLKYKIIIGDNSDNIKGLYKYGPVKTKKFIENWKENLSKLEEDDKKILFRNLLIMDLKRGYKQYPDELQFYEDQLVLDLEKEFDLFFEKCEKLGLNPIVYNKSEWKGMYNPNMLASLDFDLLMSNDK